MYLHFINSSTIFHNLAKKINCLKIGTGTRSNYNILQMPKNVIRLFFGHNYSHFLQLTKRLKYLCMANNVCKYIKLTPNIVFLIITHDAKMTIDNISSVTHVKLKTGRNESNYYNVCENLPNGVHTVEHIGLTKNLINNFPNTVNEVINNYHFFSTKSKKQPHTDHLSLHFHQIIYHMEKW